MNKQNWCPQIPTLHQATQPSQSHATDALWAMAHRQVSFIGKSSTKSHTIHEENKRFNSRLKGRSTIYNNWTCCTRKTPSTSACLTRDVSVPFVSLELHRLFRSRSSYTLNDQLARYIGQRSNFYIKTQPSSTIYSWSQTEFTLFLGWSLHEDHFDGP